MIKINTIIKSKEKKNINAKKNILLWFNENKKILSILYIFKITNKNFIGDFILKNLTNSI
jgi:hypothetical protein